jgi:FtsZ-interacting cell division protein ZipA
MKVLLSLAALVVLMGALIFLIRSGLSSRFERSQKNNDSKSKSSKVKKAANPWNELSRGEDPTL